MFSYGKSRVCWVLLLSENVNMKRDGGNRRRISRQFMKFTKACIHNNKNCKILSKQRLTGRSQKYNLVK